MWTGSISKCRWTLGRALANVVSSPEWGRLDKQIYGPGDKYHWESAWKFGTI